MRATRHMRASLRLPCSHYFSAACHLEMVPRQCEPPLDRAHVQPNQAKVLRTCKRYALIFRVLGSSGDAVDRVRGVSFGRPAGFAPDAAVHWKMRARPLPKRRAPVPSVKASAALIAAAEGSEAVAAASAVRRPAQRRRASLCLRDCRAHGCDACRQLCEHPSVGRFTPAAHQPVCHRS